jgi:hypothetical protein
VLRLEHDRHADLEVLERDVRSAKEHPRRGQRHFHIARARERNAAVDHVIGEHRHALRIELVFPRERMLVQAVAEQRMIDVAIHEVVALDGGRLPVAFALPWIGRQRRM